MDTSLLQRSLVLIKPDGLQRGLAGRIISRFEDAGLKIVGMKLMQADAALARKHYEEHVEKPFYQSLENMIIMGPVVAMVIEGIEAVEVIRKLVGATEPKEAAPGTIRGDFSHMSYDFANGKDIGLKNIIHASAEVDEAEREVGLWFTEDEILPYPSVHDAHTLN